MNINNELLIKYKDTIFFLLREKFNLNTKIYREIA